MSYVDVKYARLVGSRLDLFKEKKTNLYNFRCPYCGDSQKHKSKARGYFFVKGSDFIFKCHNCGVGRTLGNFLKDNARDLYDQFVLERYKMGLTGKSTRVAEPKFTSLQTKPIFNTGTKIPKISDLNKEHPARIYLEEGRRLPSQALEDLYYVDNFKEWTNQHKETFDNVEKDEPRIIIPLRRDGTIIGYQGRSLVPNSKIKYITIMLQDDALKRRIT